MNLCFCKTSESVGWVNSSIDRKREVAYHSTHLARREVESRIARRCRRYTYVFSQRQFLLSDGNLSMYLKIDNVDPEMHRGFVRK
jgi:hypothetical protein